MVSRRRVDAQAASADLARDADVLVGLLFAAHAAVAYAAAQQSAGLQAAPASRQLIGQAQGILMERRRLSAEEGFDELVRVSQGSNTKLSAVAATLAETGELTG